MQAFAPAAGMLGGASPFAAAGAQPSAAPSTHNAAPASASLFVKGLGKGVNERQLHAIFSAFGTVVDCQVCAAPMGGVGGGGAVLLGERSSSPAQVCTAP